MVERRTRIVVFKDPHPRCLDFFPIPARAQRSSNRPISHRSNASNSCIGSTLIRTVLEQHGLEDYISAKFPAWRNAYSFVLNI